MSSVSLKKIAKLSLIFLASLTFVFLLLIYFYYKDLKKTFVLSISNKASTLIGHDVHIKDFSITPFGTLGFYDIKIENPEKFISGDLLHVKKLYVKINIKELLKRKIYFEKIIVDSPKLTLIKDARGRFNISEQLKKFFKREPTLKYRITVFTIKDGSFDLNNIDDYRINNINITLKDLSSEAGTKTFIDASSSFLNNTIGMKGWIYLKNDPKKINITVLSKNFTFISFKKFFERYKVELDKTKADVKIGIIGDFKDGVNIDSEFKIRDIQSIYTKDKINPLFLYIKAFLNLRSNTLNIKDCVLLSDKHLAIKCAGTISNLYKNPEYEGKMVIHKLDLSIINLIRKADLKGYITSDTIKIKGENIKTTPFITGTFFIRDSIIRSDILTLQKFNGKLKFSYNRDNLLKIDGSTRILKAGRYFFQQYPTARISMRIEKSRGQTYINSSTRLSSLQFFINKDKRVSVRETFLKIDGVLKNKTFSGRNSLIINDFSYSDYHIDSLRTASNIKFKKDHLMIQKQYIEMEKANFFAGLINVNLRQKINTSIEMKNVRATFDKKKIKIFTSDIFLEINRDKRVLNGRFDFSNGKIIVSDAISFFVSGKGVFDEEEFSVSIHRSEVAGGNMNLEVKGETKQIFPLSIGMEAKNIEIGKLYQIVSKFMKFPYNFSGNIEYASFNGMLLSLKDVRGNGLLNAPNITISEVKKKRDIIKKGILRSEIQVKGQDIHFTTRIDIGGISALTSGIIEKAMEKDRFIALNLEMPDIKISDIRNVFWDIFPDKLLYVHLNGSLSSSLKILYDHGLSVQGKVFLKDLFLVGENNEYSIGPVNGIIPIAYGKKFPSKSIKVPSFELSSFDELKKYYSEDISRVDYSLVTIDSLIYGFNLLKDINIWLKQDGNILNIKYFNGNIFGGQLKGSATVTFLDNFQFTAGFIVNGLSLKKLCEEIEPIRGYLSGNVDGIGSLKGSVRGISEFTGKADFWTYSTKSEKTTISKNFLRKIRGPSLKAYMRDRSFDKGIMRLYFMNGYIVFKELEISNKNFLGITDLSVKVAPFNNRIAIDDLVWTIIEAAQRTKSEK